MSQIEKKFQRWLSEYEKEEGQFTSADMEAAYRAGWLDRQEREENQPVPRTRPTCPECQTIFPAHAAWCPNR